SAGAGVYGSEQKLRQAAATQAADRVVCEPAAEIETIPPCGNVPVVVAAPHHAAFEGVTANDLGDVVNERVSLHALDGVLPILRTESTNVPNPNVRHDLIRREQEKVFALNMLQYFVIPYHAVRIRRGHLSL